MRCPPAGVWTGTSEVVFAVAGGRDVDAVLDVLDDAAAWLTGRGVKQWPERFSPQLVVPAIERGETWLAIVDGQHVGTVTVSEVDPAWADLPASAIYVHRMATKRGFSGLGDRILNWVEHRAATAGKSHVRLDCVASNTDLCRYYQTRGFRPRGDVYVGGAPGQRLADDAHMTTVRRLEKSTRPQPQ